MATDKSAGGGLHERASRPLVPVGRLATCAAALQRLILSDTTRSGSIAPGPAQE